MAEVTSPAVNNVVNAIRDFVRSRCLDNVTESKTKWFEETLKTVKVKTEQELTMDRFNSSSITKMTLAKWLDSARDIMTRQADIITQMQETMEMQKTDALEDKAAIIKLQSVLIESKDQQLLSLQSAVQETVQTTVQQEVQSYSAALSKHSAAPNISADSLKQAVKSAIAEEDRTKNVMVFGLCEEEEEQLETKVGGLFLELGEKPKLTASRVGRKAGADKCRPVKVVLSSANNVNQILMKSGTLKRIAQFEKVYLRPDMSAEERAARKILVVELKQAINDQPTRYHYIQGGTIHSRDKVGT